MTAIDLSARHALVTGGARGLGTAMAQALADSGASVVIADLLDEEGTASAKTLSDNGTKAAFVHLDVTDDDNWAIAVEEAIAAIGGFDILVNNAGIEITQLVADLDAADTLRMLSVNVLGTALGTKHAFRAMRPGGAAGNGGAVINTASVAGLLAPAWMAPYNASKHAAVAVSESLYHELATIGSPVGVSVLCPGFVKTNIGEADRNRQARFGPAPDPTLPMQVRGILLKYCFHCHGRDPEDPKGSLLILDHARLIAPPRPMVIPGNTSGDTTRGKSRCAHWPSACTPASVRPAPCTVTRAPQKRATAVSSASCTERPFAWRCQPTKPAPSYSSVSL